jgi:hypothetical protein
VAGTSITANVGSTAITINKHGDAIKGSGTILAGTVAYPNVPDSGIYISPVWISENSVPVAFNTGIIRGRMRGFYQFCHAIGVLSDAEIITGDGDYTGKTFRVVLKGGNLGVYLIETSNTLETN